MIRNRRAILGLLAAGVLSAMIAPFLLRADDPELDLRRRQIEGMSEADRERLERNFEQFDVMSEEQRHHLREFDAALQADRLNNRGRLSDTLNVYTQWLRTVTPHQRDALQQETSPAKRIALIREIVDSQRDERVETRMGGRAEGFLGSIPDLNEQDLAAMLAIIGRHAQRLVPQDALEELKDYPENRRHLKLLELMARNRRTVDDLLSDTTMRQLLEAVSDEETRRELESIPEGERLMPTARAQKRKLGLAIQKAIFTELDQEQRRRELTRENLERHFNTLGVEEQDELLTLAPEEFRQELRSRYIQSEWAGSPVLEYIRQFFRSPRPGNRPRPGDRPSPGGPRRGGREQEGPPRPPERRPFHQN